MDELFILASVFVAVLIVAFLIINYFVRRREIARNISLAQSQREKSNADIDQILGSGNENIRYYLDTVQNEKKDSIRMRLVQAGYFSPRAITYFNLIRAVFAVLVFIIVQLSLSLLLPQFSTAALTLVAMIAATLVFVAAAVIVEMMGNRRSREFRKLFPDFMDLLLVCVDAGLSINAAIDRVTREFLLTTPDFGIQLSIINLEIRAGRPLHEALNNFSKRIDVEEARTLAVLFKQSQELGASVSKTLRVFSSEMRQMRLVRAEEKANALPIKMLFPLALFMFPVNLIIILIPIMLIIFNVLLMMSPR